MNLKLYLVVCACFFYVNLFTQTNQYFKVEFDAFTPPLKAMIDNVEGKPIKNFMIKDLLGKDHTMSMNKGKKVIMWFWDDSAESGLLMPIMEGFAEHNKSIVFLALYNEPKEKLDPSYTSNDKPYKILPNAAFIGEAIFDKELGTPRVYLIDEKSIVKMVLPSSYLQNTSDVISVIDNFVNNKIH